MTLLELTPDQASSQSCFRELAEETIAPAAARCDKEERLPTSLIRAMGQAGCFAMPIPDRYGGRGSNAIATGLMHYELARASAAAQGLANVSNMASLPIARLGREEQRRKWLPSIARGDKIAAIAITEPDTGTDVKSISTTAEKHDDVYVLNGEKRWISFAQVADVFLVLAKLDGNLSAFVVDRDSDGLHVAPIRGTLGCRAYMIGEMKFDGCEVPASALVGMPGAGLSWVVNTALDAGRYNLSWGCVGLAQACFESCLAYVKDRVQFGVPIAEHQLVQQVIADMSTEIQAARMLCCHAGKLRDAGENGAVTAAMMAKYYASRMVNRVASNAVQLHGANGCSDSYPLERYMRDAKVMEIIEGTTQIHQVMLAQAAYRSHAP